MPTVTIHDPRYVDGDPHEIAELAGSDLRQALALASEAASHFHWAARGAWLSAEEHRTGDMPKGEEFEHTSQAGKIAGIQVGLAASLVDANTVQKAASWNPKTYP